MIKRITVFALLLSMLLVVSACSTSVDYPMDGESKGVFYEVNGGENKLYLFGTVHVGDEDMYPLHKDVEKAFHKSDVLGLEIDMVNISEFQLVQEILEMGMYNDFRRLSQFVSDETFNSLVEILAPLGIDADTLDVFKPWYVAMILSDISIAETGFTGELGVESYLTDNAEDKEIIGLESISDQLTPFTLLSPDAQVMYLENSLEEMDSAQEEINKLVDAWKQGDVDFFAEIRGEMMGDFPTTSYGKFQEATLDGRDTQMTNKIVDLLESDSGKTYFIAVGTLHLVGENSIVDQLEQKGYQVTSGWE